MDVGNIKDAAQIKMDGTLSSLLQGQANSTAYLSHYAAQPLCTQIIIASTQDIQIPLDS